MLDFLVLRGIILIVYNITSIILSYLRETHNIKNSILAVEEEKDLTKQWSF